MDGVIIYIENSKNLTIKRLKLVSDHSKVVGYEVNIQKAIILLYTSDKWNFNFITECYLH